MSLNLDTLSWSIDNWHNGGGGKGGDMRGIMEGQNLVLGKVSRISKSLDLCLEVTAGSLASGPDSTVGASTPG